jgi:hypothetical protein
VAKDILIRFLNAGLIDVGGDDAKLGKLKETAADLATALKKAPSKAAPFALIAFDPEAPVCDSVVKEVVEALQRRWATYVNTFSGTSSFSSPPQRRTTPCAADAGELESIWLH